MMMMLGFGGVWPLAVSAKVNASRPATESARQSFTGYPPIRRLGSGDAVLTVGVLQRDLAVSKLEQITTMHFHASTIGACSRECPFRNAPLSLDVVAREIGRAHV